MNIYIREIHDDDDEICAVKNFLYGQIKEVYDIGPTPEFHYDIEGLKEHYKNILVVFQPHTYSRTRNLLVN